MKSSAIFLLILAASAQAGAQNIKPGLWELSVKVKSADAQTDQALSAAVKQLESLPPEQRARLDAMMQQNGVTLPAIKSDGAMRRPYCITPEMAASKELPLPAQGQCSSKREPIAGGYKISYECSKPQARGQGTVLMNGDSAFTGTMDASSDTGNGRMQKVTVETTGRWIKPSCSPQTP
ncbi:DUF3617 family protein [Pseudoduganella sp. FT93W]|uniref:DUF3617 family protein n=1 Tax=Duganella fentianensis TaxID=2692177 RepID=A0A845HXP3_9BURK|nr:DUF3617 domain-containing protein [Duganella fentianensis]MYN44507.1 DUF3617 family protein [Duganella fentianensis]